MINLRPYQKDLKTGIYTRWDAGDRNVMAVSSVGSGKTVVMGSVLNEHQGVACAIAHRQELVGQISMALAREGVRHTIIGPSSVMKFVVNEQLNELSTHFYDPNAQVAVAGVDTLIRRHRNLKPWLDRVSLWVIDESHHIAGGNKWMKAVSMMPNARGLGVTATPCRADGLGLGRHAGGVFDAMVEGPSMRWLIDNKFLSEYRIFAPPSDLDISEVPLGASGDFVQKKLKRAVQRSHIVGDVVEHYLRIAPGKLGITFATDVDTATEIALKFNEAGVPAEVVSAKTPDTVRSEIIRRFRNRELLQLVNVDLFGEGFDLPAIEVVSMARPTQSYGLYVQQFGRGLRILEGKSEAIIIDHVGNVARHGLPDRERIWSLDAREKSPQMKNDDDDIPLRYCPECTQPYERFHRCCPYCGHHPVPAGRDKPEYVDGDLLELSPETLAQMREEVATVDAPVELIRDRMQYAGAPRPAWMGAMKQHGRRKEAQAALRESISWWAGIMRHKGRSDSESYRMFYHMFGMDVLSAQALGRPEALALAEKINGYIGRC